jgi:nucleoside triphosphatase
MSYPEPIVGALIRNETGEILLVRQAKWNNKYCIPGGHVELNETIEEAIKREIQEEVGLNVEVVELLGVQDNIHSVEFHKKKHFIFLDYLCETSEEKVRLDNREAQEFLWIHPENALALSLNDGTRTTIKRFLTHLTHEESEKK